MYESLPLTTLSRKLNAAESEIRDNDLYSQPYFSSFLSIKKKPELLEFAVTLGCISFAIYAGRTHDCAYQVSISRLNMVSTAPLKRRDWNVKHRMIRAILTSG